MPTLAQVNKQREATGAQTVAKPLSTRQVQQQAAFQDQQRAQTLLNKQGTVQSYIDPSTGKDSRQFTIDASGNRVPVEGTGTFGTFTTYGPLSTVDPAARDRLAAIANQGLTNQYQQQYVPPGQDPGVIEQLRNIRQMGLEGGVSAQGQVEVRGVNLDQNGNPIGAATPQQIQQNQLNLQGIMNATRGMDATARQSAMNIAARAASLDPSKLPKAYEQEPIDSYQFRQAQVAQQQAVVLQQLNDFLQRQAQSQVRNQNTNVLGLQPGQEQQTGIPSPGGPQEMPAGPGQQQGQYPTPQFNFDPSDPSASMLQGAADRFTQERDAMLQDIGQPDYLGFARDKAEAKQMLNDRLDLVDDIDDLQRQRADEKQRKALAENQRAQDYSEAQSAEAILDQMEANEEMEVQSRRRINKLSGGHDFSGVKYVSKNIQDGRDALHFLQLKAGILRGQYADRAVNIINEYSLDMRQADIDKKTGYRDAYGDYTTRLSDIEEDLNKDVSEKRKERRETHKWYSEQLTKLDFQHGDNLNALRLKAIDRMNTLDKIRATAENNQINQAIKMLALATKKGVKMSPEAMQAFEKQIAPDLNPGWLSMSVAGAGGGAGGTSYKNWTPSGLAAAQQWVQAQPGRSFNDLSPSDQEWLVPFSEGSVPGQPQPQMIQQSLPPGVAGPVQQTRDPNFNPFSSIEQPKAASTPTYVKEFDEIVSRTGSAPKNAQGQPMSLQEYVGQRSFNFLLQQGGGFPSTQPVQQQQTTIIQQPQYDPADDILSSDDADSFDFE